MTDADVLNWMLVDIKRPYDKDAYIKWFLEQWRKYKQLGY